MKRILGLILGMGMLMTSVAFAANNGAGCGLGSRFFEGKDGLLFNLLAGTTNQIYSTNTFAMTSQTSGCDQDSVVLREKEQAVFIAVNLDNLSLDMARGSGQYLQSMAELMGCRSATFGEFAALTQDRYEVLFPSVDTVAIDVLAGLKSEMARHSVLSRSCSRIS